VLAVEVIRFRSRDGLDQGRFDPVGAFVSEGHFGGSGWCSGWQAKFGIHVRVLVSRIPADQGKIERSHRTMKNVVKLQHYYFPEELKTALRDFVSYYNYCSYDRNHESLGNVIPADVYYGRQYEVLSKRSKIKRSSRSVKISRAQNSRDIRSSRIPARTESCTLGE
jgi:hypothetical protein